jgi:hypothetical protein
MIRAFTLGVALVAAAAAGPITAPAKPITGPAKPVTARNGLAWKGSLACARSRRCAGVILIP